MSVFSLPGQQDTSLQCVPLTDWRVAVTEAVGTDTGTKTILAARRPPTSRQTDTKPPVGDALVARKPGTCPDGKKQAVVPGPSLHQDSGPVACQDFRAASRGWGHRRPRVLGGPAANGPSRAGRLWLRHPWGPAAAGVWGEKGAPQSRRRDPLPQQRCGCASHGGTLVSGWRRAWWRPGVPRGQESPCCRESRQDLRSSLRGPLAPGGHGA